MKAKEVIEAVGIAKSFSYDGRNIVLQASFYSQYPLDYRIVNVTPDKTQEYASVLNIDSVISCNSKALLDELAEEIYGDSLSPSFPREWFVEDTAELVDFIEKNLDDGTYSLGFYIKQYISERDISIENFRQAFVRDIDEFSSFIENFLDVRRLLNEEKEL